MPDMSSAIVYIACGHEYETEVLRSIESVGDQYPCIVCAPKPVKGVETFILPPRKYDHWFLDRVRYFNLIAHELPHKRILMLDSDTYVCGDLSGFFDILSHFDIAGTHAIGRQTVVRGDIPASFSEMHCGAFSFKRSDRILDLFARWFQIYRARPVYFGNDQPPLRQALWESDIVRLAILPPEFCFRFRWGGLIKTRVKVLHGKEHNTTYEQVATELNGGKCGIRIYHRRELA